MDGGARTSRGRHRDCRRGTKLPTRGGLRAPRRMLLVRRLVLLARWLVSQGRARVLPVRGLGLMPWQSVFRALKSVFLTWSTPRRLGRHPARPRGRGRRRPQRVRQRWHGPCGQPFAHAGAPDEDAGKNATRPQPTHQLLVWHRSNIVGRQLHEPLSLFQLQAHRDFLLRMSVDRPSPERTVLFVIINININRVALRRDVRIAVRTSSERPGAAARAGPSRAPSAHAH